MFCAKCGKNIPDNACFCQFCGAPVAPPEDKTTAEKEWQQPSGSGSDSSFGNATEKFASPKEDVKRGKSGKTGNTQNNPAQSPDGKRYRKGVLRMQRYSVKELKFLVGCLALVNICAWPMCVVMTVGSALVGVVATAPLLYFTTLGLVNSIQALSLRKKLDANIKAGSVKSKVVSNNDIECPACGGYGKIGKLTASASRSNVDVRRVKCRWCNGKGYADAESVAEVSEMLKTVSATWKKDSCTVCRGTGVILDAGGKQFMKCPGCTGARVIVFDSKGALEK